MKNPLIKPDENKPNVFKSLIHVETDDIVVNESCRLCNHRLRFSAESYWVTQKFNMSKTLIWLNEQIKDKNNLAISSDDKENDFTYQSVRNHLSKHYADQERQIRLKEYAGNIEALIKDKQTHENMLDVALAACKENLARVASLDTYGDTNSEFKRSDSINKVINQMLSVMNEQSKLKGEIDAFDIVQEKFTNLWIDLINNEKNEAKQKIYIKMLEEFSGHVEGDFGNG